MILKYVSVCFLSALCISSVIGCTIAFKNNELQSQSTSTQKCVVDIIKNSSNEILKVKVKNCDE